MAHETQWLVPERVYYVQYKDQVSIADTHQVIREYLAMLKQLPNQAHIISDFSANTLLDFSLKEALASDERRLLYDHPKLGWSVIVADQHISYFYLFASALRTHLAAKVTAVRTLDEAVKYILDHDSSISGIPTSAV